MTNPVRSILMVGVSLLTASAVVIAPSVAPPPPPKATPTVHSAAAVQLAAAVQQLQQQPPLLTVLRDSPLRLLGPAAPFGTLPPPPAPAQFAIAPNLADTIDGIYIAVEPWVQYGFEVATAVVRWIPYVGWFAGQIMVFYNFFESMVASGVFNFTDWLRGDGGAVENLVDFGIDVGLAFVWLGLDEVAQFVPLPPFCCYPPRPPVQGPFLAAAERLLNPTETATLTTSASTEEATGVSASTEQVDGTVQPEVPRKGRIANAVTALVDEVTGLFKQSATTDGSTVENGNAVKEAEEPKVPKNPKVTSTSAGEVRRESSESASESTKDSNDNKKRNRGPSTKGATKSSTESSASDTGSKHDSKGEKKDRTDK